MKAIVLLLSAVLVIAFTGLVFAQDEVKAPDNDHEMQERVVGDDIEIGEGEFKIISIDENDAVVGDDIDIEDGEFKIISIDENDAVVGDDIDIEDGEFKIISIMDPAPVVGDDIDIGDDMAKIISIVEENEKDNKPLVAGISAGVIVLAGAILLLTKKKQQ